MQTKHRPSLWQYLFSILAAAFGVQSQSNRERDFNAGNPWVFILGGLGFTITFILILILIANWVVP